MFLAAWPVWGSAPLASSYRGPDNVAGPLLGQLNPAKRRGFLSVVLTPLS
jgi:hypothetical protein